MINLLRPFPTGVMLLAIAASFSGCRSNGNHALEFDGVNDFIELGNIYDSLAFPVSMSAWIYLDSTDGHYAFPIFISQDDFSAEHNGVTFAVMGDAGAVTAGYGDGLGANRPAYRRGKAAYTKDLTGRWIHLAANLRAPDDIEIFIDGLLTDATFSGDSNQPIGSNFPDDIATIATWSQNDEVHRFKGAIDEVRLWNRSLSAAEIQTTMNKKLTGLEPDLIGYWSFDEDDTTKVFDASPHKHHGTIKGAPKRIPGAF